MCILYSQCLSYYMQTDRQTERLTEKYGELKG
jgi:hypothetical protein